jgi:hypothetical protein
LTVYLKPKASHHNDLPDSLVSSNGISKSCLQIATSTYLKSRFVIHASLTRKHLPEKELQLHPASACFVKAINASHTTKCNLVNIKVFSIQRKKVKNIFNVKIILLRIRQCDN